MQTTQPQRLLLIATSPLFARIFLRDQIRLLRTAGFDVSLVCSSEEGAHTLEEELGCRVHLLPMARSIHPVRDLSSLIQLIRILRDRRPAMVHTHTPKAGLLGTVAAWLCRVPVRVHTVHGLRSETLEGIKRLIVTRMERLTSACATHCLAVSCSLRQEIIRRNLCPPAKLRVLGFGSCAGIPIQRFQWAGYRDSAQAFRSEHDMPANALLVTCIGRVARDKGIHTLASAWAILRDRIPQAWLLVAGPEDPTDPCDPATLEALDADPRVLRHGFVEDVAPFLAATDLFVQPSLREGLGVAALEASAMRIPVIASRVTGLVDTVQEGRTGLLVEPQNPEALALAMEDLLSFPALRTAMGKDGLRFVERRFDRRVVLQNTLTFYRELLTAPRPQHPARRILDITAAASLLVLTAPLIALVALAIKLTMGGPVLFRQQRAGFAERPFLLLKFRTMRAPRPHEPALRTDAARTTTLGLWLRKLSLDELPQLWNVLCGEMSLIGPRPLLMEYVPRYSATEHRRHHVKPGITGWAQVNGRNNTAWRQRFALDVWYVDHQSLALDLRIAWMTLHRLIRPEGIVPAGQAAMTEFMGSPAQPQP